MKLKTHQIPQFLKSPPPQCSVVLLYGPDSGLVRERGTHLSKTVLEDLSDPFRVAILGTKEISEQPSILADEASALSLTGGRRLIRVKDAGEGVTRALGHVAELDPSKVNALIIVEAGDLPPRSGLRKLTESHDTMAAIPCYADDEQTLRAVIQQTLKQHNLTTDQDVAHYLMTHLGGDRQITLSELEKLCLYMANDQSQGPQAVTLADAQAVIGDSSTITVDDAVRATALGQPEAMEHALDRAFASGLPSIQILRAHLRHFQRLFLVAGHVQNGLSVDAAMGKLTPRIFFKEQGPFRQQMQSWPLRKLVAAIGILEEAEIQCKTTGMPDVTICRRALLRIARASQQSR